VCAPQKRRRHCATSEPLLEGISSLVLRNFFSCRALLPGRDKKSLGQATAAGGNREEEKEKFPPSLPPARNNIIMLPKASSMGLIRLRSVSVCVRAYVSPKAAAGAGAMHTR